MSDKHPEAFRTISEVATDLDLPQHVLRFWETKFSQIRPTKRSSGRRFYRPEDVALIRTIRDLLYRRGYTIRGVQQLLKEKGTKAVSVELPANAAATASGVNLDGAVTEPAVSSDAGTAGVELHGVELHGVGALLSELRACIAILHDARGG